MQERDRQREKQRAQAEAQQAEMGIKGSGSVDNPVSPDYRGEMAVPGSDARPMGYGDMSAEELSGRLSDVTVLDVSKTHASPEEMKIAGALIKDPDRVDWANDLPKGRVYVLYDESPDQVISSKVADRLIGAGHDQVFVLQGGMQQWRKSGLPVEPRTTTAASGQSPSRSDTSH
jgi:rhodanese-related sulfurtransferase